MYLKISLKARHHNFNIWYKHGLLFFIAEEVVNEILFLSNLHGWKYYICECEDNNKKI